MGENLDSPVGANMPSIELAGEPVKKRQQFLCILVQLHMLKGCGIQQGSHGLSSGFQVFHSVSVID